MEQQYFEFSKMKEHLEITDLLSVLSGDMFLLDYDNETVTFSQQIAKMFQGNCETPAAQVPLKSVMESLTPKSREILARDIERLKQKRTSKISSHLNMMLDSMHMTDFIVVMIPLKQDGLALGICQINFDLMHERDQQMEEVIQQLKQMQSVNQLILEGSTDYIYQLDLVNNVCTFSPKSVEVLPLEHHTFSNAMDRILGFIIPEDRSIFLNSFVPFLTGKSDYHTAEYRVMTKQGEIMWISCHGKGLHDESGNPIMIAGSLMDITKSKKNEEKINRVLYYDMLTGLKNRRRLEMDLNEYFAREPDATGSILCIDIQNFKVFNEIFSHDFANNILKEFVDILNLYITENLGVYRLEGDEFIVHIPESEPEKILEKMAAFEMCLSKARIIEGHTVYIRARTGVAIYPLNGHTGEELIKNALTALQVYGISTASRTNFFQNEGMDAISKRYQLENELRKDIGNQMKHFRLVYQPVIEYIGDTPVWHGAEALLRYENPDFPNVGQMEMIEILEHTDLIIPVGRWVMQTAIKECARWHSMGVDAYINVNLSARQVSDAGLLTYITQCCTSAGLDYNRLVCELTETSLVKNFEIAHQFCAELRKLGIGVALDDFGTGYSSFNYLRRLPLSVVKVDREYVQRLETEQANQIILRCLYDLSKVTGLSLCVEGIETERIANMLHTMGIPLMQGYYFERPLEVDIFRREILNHAPVRPYTEQH